MIVSQSSSVIQFLSIRLSIFFIHLIDTLLEYNSRLSFGSHHSLVVRISTVDIVFSVIKSTYYVRMYVFNERMKIHRIIARSDLTPSS